MANIRQNAPRQELTNLQVALLAATIFGVAFELKALIQIADAFVLHAPLEWNLLWAGPTAFVMVGVVFFVRSFDKDQDECCPHLA